MELTLPLDDVPPPAAVRPAMRVGEDNALIKVAAGMAREMAAYRPGIYWADFLTSVTVGYGGLALLVVSQSTTVAVLAFVVSVLALYRAGSFIHELSHMKGGEVPGFRLVWNMLAGIPLMIPSFMYEGVHTLHHARNRYGTVRDPEYMALALKPKLSVPLFVAVAALGPIGLLIRYSILAPLSLVVPGLRSAVVARFSALSINPEFRREAESGEELRRWHVQEAATSAFAIGLLTSVALGVISLRAFGLYLLVLSASMVLNQVRTLAAHLWENDGAPMSLTAQYLDSVNVPPPAVLPALWAPVGLRYHALHHLLPGLPYHALGSAHKALLATLPADNAYHGGNHRSLAKVVRRLWQSAGSRRSA